MSAIFRVFSRRLHCTACRSDAIFPLSRSLSNVSTPRGFATDSKVQSTVLCNFDSVKIFISYSQSFTRRLEIYIKGYFYVDSCTLNPLNIFQSFDFLSWSYRGGYYDDRTGGDKKFSCLPSSCKQGRDRKKSLALYMLWFKFCFVLKMFNFDFPLSQFHYHYVNKGR